MARFNSDWSDCGKSLESACKAYAYRTAIQDKVKADREAEKAAEDAWEDYLFNLAEPRETRIEEPKVMKNGSSMKGIDFDACPVHQKPEVKEYRFGMQDATVIKWKCGCCACQIGDSLDDDGTYHTNYPDAAGRARLGVAIAAAK